MHKPNHVAKYKSLQMWGTVGRPDFKTAVIDGDYAISNNGKKFHKSVIPYLDFFSIYQRVKAKAGEHLKKVEFYNYNITHTEQQQVNRKKFADACHAWTLLTDEQKEEWRIKLKYRKMNVQAYFISKYMKDEV